MNNYQTSVREGREELAKNAKKSRFFIESFRDLRVTFALFAYGCPLSDGGAP
jgi:hypothetical protein